MEKENNFQILKNLNEEKLKSYCDFFKKHNLQEFYVDENGIEVSLKAKSPPQHLGVAPEAVMTSPPPISGAMVNAKETEESEEKDESEANYKKVISPLAGVFYVSPSPNDPPFVKVGDKIKKDQKVCIIEAMKVMNEITAEENGIVEKILVENQQNVTQGQVLMLLK